MRFLAIPNARFISNRMQFYLPPAPQIFRKINLCIWFAVVVGFNERPLGLLRC